jgi:hypothetical protein
MQANLNGGKYELAHIHFHWGSNNSYGVSFKMLAAMLYMMYRPQAFYSLSTYLLSTRVRAIVHKKI